MYVCGVNIAFLSSISLVDLVGQKKPLKKDCQTNFHRYSFKPQVKKFFTRGFLDKGKNEPNWLCLEKQVPRYIVEIEIQVQQYQFEVSGLD